MDTVRRLVFTHRRPFAALFAGLAVLAGLGAVTQSADGVRVVVARHDLPSGRVVSADDLRVVVLAAAPDHALNRSEAIGRRVAGPMRSGEPFTDRRVLTPGALDGYGKGVVLTSVAVPATAGADNLRVGDRIDIVAVDPHGETKAEVVARDVEVVTLPEPGEGDSVALGIVTTEPIALALASAGLESRFTVVQSA